MFWKVINQWYQTYIPIFAQLALENNTIHYWKKEIVLIDTCRAVNNTEINAINRFFVCPAVKEKQFKTEKG